MTPNDLTTGTPSFLCNKAKICNILVQSHYNYSKKQFPFWKVARQKSL